MTERDFYVGEDVVYPSHGVGKILKIEDGEIAGSKMQFYIIEFPQDNMLLRIPVSKSTKTGLRHLCSKEEIDQVLAIIKCKAKRGNRMWSRRAQEYETKINSGNLLSIAEVIRDLYKNVSGDCSYSERLIFETAIARVASEISIVEKSHYDEILNKIYDLMREKVAA
ncbi:MAG: CarD family transcriptional regulator [Rickettsia sp.]|nr:CarD family transcriptional regulator [Rickettsia sp.]